LSRSEKSAGTLATLVPGLTAELVVNGGEGAAEVVADGGIVREFIVQRAQTAHGFFEASTLDQLFALAAAILTARAAQIGLFAFENLVEQAASLGVVVVLLEERFENARSKTPVAFAASRLGPLEGSLSGAHSFSRGRRRNQLWIPAEFCQTAGSSFAGLIRLAGIEMTLDLGAYRIQCDAPLLLDPNTVEQSSDLAFAGVGVLHLLKQLRRLQQLPLLDQRVRLFQIAFQRGNPCLLLLLKEFLPVARQSVGQRGLARILLERPFQGRTSLLHSADAFQFRGLIQGLLGELASLMVSASGDDGLAEFEQRWVVRERLQCRFDSRERSLEVFRFQKRPRIIPQALYLGRSLLDLLSSQFSLAQGGFLSLTLLKLLL
jgi:hypothetical protein